MFGVAILTKIGDTAHFAQQLVVNKKLACALAAVLTKNKVSAKRKPIANPMPLLAPVIKTRNLQTLTEAKRFLEENWHDL